MKVFVQPTETDLKKDEALKQLQDVYNDIEKAKQELASFENLQDKIKAAESTLNDRLQDIDMMKVAIETAKNQHDTKLSELKKESDTSVGEIDFLKLSILSLKSELLKHETKLNDLIAELSLYSVRKDEVQKEISDLITKSKQIQAENDSALKDLATTKAQHANAKTAYESVMTELRASKDSIASNLLLVKEQNDHIDELRLIVESLKQAKEKANLELSELKIANQKEKDDFEKDRSAKIDDINSRTADVSERERLLFKKTEDLKAAKEYLEQFYNKKLDKIII